MSKLEKLLGLCKCSVTITVNDHRDYYQTAEQWYNEQVENKWIEASNIEASVINKMIELDEVIQIQFYPQTPISFYVVHHYDMDKALDECLSTFK